MGCSAGSKCWLFIWRNRNKLFSRCNVAAVKGCAKWASCTLISKCDITSLSSQYKDCAEVLKGALCTVKQGETKVGMVSVEKAWENIPVQFPIWSVGKKKRQPGPYWQTKIWRRQREEWNLNRISLFLLVNSKAAVPRGCLQDPSVLYCSKGQIPPVLLI